MGRCRLNLFVSGQGPMAKTYVHDTQSLGSIKCGGFYGWLRNSLRLKKYMLLEIIYFLGLIYIENSTPNLISVHSRRFASAASKREHTFNTVSCIRLKEYGSACVRELFFEGV